MAMSYSIGIIYILAYSLLFELVHGGDKNCYYLDSSQHDRTNYLQCHGNGCCGEFTDRHCCIGPIATVAIVFGVLFGTLIIVVVSGVCYVKCKKTQRKQTQVIPTIVADSYSDIPLPSPPVRAPPVYNTARLHPPTFTSQPFRAFKTFDQEEHPPPSNLHPPRLHTIKFIKK